MKVADYVVLVLYTGVIVALAVSVGRTQGSQNHPIACEPKCTFTYRAGKLINVTCPDSTGAMP